MRFLPSRFAARVYLFPTPYWALARFERWDAAPPSPLRPRTSAIPRDVALRAEPSLRPSLGQGRARQRPRHPRRDPAGSNQPHRPGQRRCCELAERQFLIAAAQDDARRPPLKGYQEAVADRGQPEGTDEPPAWGLGRFTWSSARSSWPRARPPKPKEAVPQRASRTGRTALGFPWTRRQSSGSGKETRGSRKAL